MAPPERTRQNKLNPMMKKGRGVKIERNTEANGRFPDFMVNLSCYRREIPTLAGEVKGSEYSVHFKASSHGSPDKTPKTALHCETLAE